MRRARELAIRRARPPRPHERVGAPTLQSASSNRTSLRRHDRRGVVSARILDPRQRFAAVPSPMKVKSRSFRTKGRAGPMSRAVPTPKANWSSASNATSSNPASSNQLRMPGVRVRLARCHVQITVAAFHAQAWELIDGVADVFVRDVAEDTARQQHIGGHRARSEALVVDACLPCTTSTPGSSSAGEAGSASTRHCVRRARRAAASTSPRRGMISENVEDVAALSCADADDTDTPGRCRGRVRRGSVAARPSSRRASDEPVALVGLVPRDPVGLRHDADPSDRPHG